MTPPAPRLCACIPLTLGAVAALLAFAAAARADTEPLARAAVGLEGRVMYRSADPALRPVPADDKADVVLRIADRVPDGPATLYDLRFIAAVPGDFDLRTHLLHPDGTLVADGSPVTVRAISSLPGDEPGDLAEIGTLPPPRLGGYRLALIVAGVVWLAPLGWYVVARRLRARPPAPEPPPAAPTLADQLRPLVEAAMAGGLGTPEQARLERLLIAHWRDRLGLSAFSHAQALSALRDHDEAGPLLAHLEDWLHRPRPAANGSTDGMDAACATPGVDLAALLRPYRDAAPIPAAPGEMLLKEAVR